MSELTRQRLRMAMVIGAVVAVLWILWLARAALVPFMIGAVVAYLISPMVDALVLTWPLNRLKLSTARGAAILLIYGAFAGVLTIVAFTAVPPLIDEMDQFIDTVPERVDQIGDWYEENISADIRQRIDDASADAEEAAGDYAADLATNSLSYLLSTVSVILGYLIIPFWLFYALKDKDENAEAFYRMFPESIRQDVRNCATLTSRITGNYIRARLIEAAFIGATVTLGLYLLGIEFALALGVIAGVAELIPFAGPILGAIPALLVAATTEDWQTVLFVLALFIGLQQLQQAIVVPNVEGRAVEMHPALILFIVVVAGQVFGFWGLLLAVPLIAITRDLFRYTYRRLEGQSGEAVMAGIVGPSAETAPSPKDLRAASVDSQETATDEAIDELTASVDEPGESRSPSQKRKESDNLSSVTGSLPDSSSGQ
jgi:predicted PurR-regulated permease PerM